MIAAQMLPADKIMVSAITVQFWAYKHVWYAPQTEFDFIVPYLGATSKEIKEWNGNLDKEVKEFQDWRASICTS